MKWVKVTFTIKNKNSKKIFGNIVDWEGEENEDVIKMPKWVLYN